MARRRDRLGIETLFRDHLKWRCRFEAACATDVAGVTGYWRRSSPSVLHPRAPPRRTVRIATAFDPQTMDPHALALLYHSRVAFQVYESLVGRDEQFRLEPALAVSWQMVDAKTWRFKLRPKASRSTTARRSRSTTRCSRSSARCGAVAARLPAQGRDSARKVDELTVELALESPDAVLPEKFSSCR